MDTYDIGYVDANGYTFLGNGIWSDPSDGSLYSESTGQWTYPQTALPATSDVANELSTAVSSGSAVGDFTNGLMQLGYTAAQIAMLYQNVKTSAQATPQMLTALQQEQAYLQQRTASSNTMWMWVGVAGLGLLFFMQYRRSPAN